MNEPTFEGSYEEHRREQMKRMAANTTPEQRIAWLEDALRLVYASGIDYLAQRRKERGDDDPQEVWIRELEEKARSTQGE